MVKAYEQRDETNTHEEWARQPPKSAVMQGRKRKTGPPEYGVFTAGSVARGVGGGTTNQRNANSVERRRGEAGTAGGVLEKRDGEARRREEGNTRQRGSPSAPGAPAHQQEGIAELYAVRKPPAMRANVDKVKWEENVSCYMVGERR